MQHEEAAEKAGEGFNAGAVIIEHVSNSSIDHPLIHLPTLFGVDFSVTKHVLMLWLVAAVLFVDHHHRGAPLPAAGAHGAVRVR